MAIAMTASCGCRLLETGYGDDNIVVRSSADAVSATTGAAKSTIAWAGAKVMSFGDDLDKDRQKLFISIGEHAAAAYRGHPELPEGYRPLSPAEFEKLALPSQLYSYEPETGFVEDAEGAGFGVRLSRAEKEDSVVVAFRGSNAPGEDEHWMQDWVVDAQQGGGGTPKQYLHGSEILSAVRHAFPDSKLVVAGHSLGGGIAAYSTINLPSPGDILCATYNAAATVQTVWERQNIATAGCDYLMLRFAEPVGPGWGLALDGVDGYVRIPEGASGYRLRLGASVVESGVLPKLALVALGPNLPQTIHLEGAYRHSLTRGFAIHLH